MILDPQVSLATYYYQTSRLVRTSELKRCESTGVEGRASSALSVEAQQHQVGFHRNTGR